MSVCTDGIVFVVPRVNFENNTEQKPLPSSDTTAVYRLYIYIYTYVGILNVHVRLRDKWQAVKRERDIIITKEKDIRYAYIPIL